MNIKNIPNTLKQLNQWVNWRDNSKIPFNPIVNLPAKTNDEITWSSFKKVTEALKTYSGVGFVVKKDNGFVFIDIDKCYDENNNLNEDGLKIISMFSKDTYVERSTNNGLHILVKGKWDIPRSKFNNIEVYTDKRFFIITGNKIKGSDIILDQNGIDKLKEYVVS